jgi:hypothetical protein
MMETAEPTTGERMFYEVRTLEQAQKYMGELVAQVERARAMVDELSRLDQVKAVPRETLRKAYQNLSVRYGQALGSLVTLMHVRILTDEAYNGYRVRVEHALAPKVVG